MCEGCVFLIELFLELGDPIDIKVHFKVVDVESVAGCDFRRMRVDKSSLNCFIEQVDCFLLALQSSNGLIQFVADFHWKWNTDLIHLHTGILLSS